MDGAAGITTELHHGLGVIRLSFAGGNMLSAEGVAALGAAFARLAADPAARAIVITGEGAQFSGGQRPWLPPPPGLGAVLSAILRAHLPVVAALNGPATGAGAALALACHGRVAVPRALLSLPAVQAGLLPAPPTVTRLALGAGAATALDLCLGGRALGAEAAHAAGLIDAVLPAGGDLIAAAARLAADLPPHDPAPPPPDAATVGAALAAVRAARARPASRLAAPARIIDTVEAAFLLPYAAACAFEEEAAADALADPPGRALRHLMAAERGLPPHLVARGEDGRPHLSPEGLAIAGGFRAAWVLAAQALVRIGATEAGVDVAARGYGHAAGPFGTGDRAPPAAQAAERLHAALLAEAARQIAAGQVSGPAEADALAVMGTGFPRWRGGPVHAANESGLSRMVQRLQLWSADDPVWEVPDRLRRAALAGRRWE